MDRTVVRHCAVAALSLGLAAVVVGIGALFDLPALAYPTLAVFGALANAAVIYVSRIEWPTLFSIFPPWMLALVLDPTLALSGGLLAGALGGLLAVPVILWAGTVADTLAATLTDR